MKILRLKHKMEEGQRGGGGNYMYGHLESGAEMITLVICGQTCSCIGYDTLSQNQRQSLHGLCMVFTRYCHDPDEQ